MEQEVQPLQQPDNSSMHSPTTHTTAAAQHDGTAPSATHVGMTDGSGTSYWDELLAHVDNKRPLQDLPTVPSDEVLDLMLRAAANALRVQLHLARLDDGLHDLLVYSVWPGVWFASD